MRAAILPLISFAVLASIVPLAWTARNRDADGFSFGGRAPSTLRALDVAADGLIDDARHEVADVEFLAGSRADARDRFNLPVHDR